MINPIGKTTTREKPKLENGLKFAASKLDSTGELPKLAETFLDWKKTFWQEKIEKEGIRNVVAPMVDQSELAFRMFCREYSAHLCYTPMIHAHLFVNDTTYRRTAFSTVDADRPLIVQFCANDPQVLLDACRLVEGLCDGVDINLGCPQIIAKKGHYGAFLQEYPDLIERMVSLVHRHCRLPLSAKIRMLSDIPSTVEYAKRIERAGACMLAIHGRTREQKGVNTGLANWEVIRELKRQLRIPVLANGNIQMPGDVERCLAETGADGVMSAEGVLNNPLLLHAENRFSFDVALEYLDFAQKYHAPHHAVRAHLFHICHYSLLKYHDLRERNAICCTLAEFRETMEELRRRSLKEMEAEGIVCGPRPWEEAVRRCFPGTTLQDVSLTQLVQSTPHYFCKPYIRPAPKLTDQEAPSLFRQQKRAEIEQIVLETGLSKRQIRKREKRKRNQQKALNRRPTYPKCQRCQQPAGLNCANQMCRRCCKFVCLRGIQTRCKAHGFEHEKMQQKRHPPSEEEEAEVASSAREEEEEGGGGKENGTLPAALLA